MPSTGVPEQRSAARSADAPSLDRALGLRDLVLFNLVAVLGLRVNHNLDVHIGDLTITPKK